MTRALALISGGLDSLLAAKIIKDQGIEVIGICFKSAFFGESNAIKSAGQVDIELKVVDFTEEHLKMVKNPKYGYGKNMNPCIDCHAMMMNYAGKMLKDMNADFIITGEVLNQRPMSQNRKALDIVKSESGFEEFILRPLCAKNLNPTKMEEEGLVDRERLYDISGRTRKVQMELAEKWNIREYPSPAGGCKLTEPGFAKRLEDLFKYKPDCSLNDIDTLKYGRHLRLNEEVKLISTRNQEEAEDMMKLIEAEDILFNTVDFTGSTVILKGVAKEADISFAAAAAARYSKGKDENEVKVEYGCKDSEKKEFITVTPLKDEELAKYNLNE